jgi:phenylacetate-CoA ligase
MEMFFEVVDPSTGRQIPPGEIGELVVTSFNPVYPLIRFGTGDLTAIDDSPCPCGRTAPRLKGLYGRVDQVTKVRAMFIHPSQVDQIIGRNQEVAHCRVVVTQQNHQDEMNFQIELKDDLIKPEPLLQKMREEIREIMRLRGEVVIVPRGTIPAEAKRIEDRRKWD